MSFLSTQFTYTHTSAIVLPSNGSIDIRTAFQTAVSIIHHHPSMCYLVPVLKNVQLLDPPPTPPPVDVSTLQNSFTLTSSEDAWNYYELKDELPMFGGWYIHHLTYHAAIRNLMHGMESLVQAPSNVTIHAVWDASVQRRRRVAVAGNVIEEGDGELCLVLTETSVIRCGKHLAWYIRGSLERNHNVMHDGFRKIWEEKMGIRPEGQEGEELGAET
jgi:hypothetical protein